MRFGSVALDRRCRMQSAAAIELRAVIRATPGRPLRFQRRRVRVIYTLWAKVTSTVWGIIAGVICLTLGGHGIQMLLNENLAIEGGNQRIYLAGIDDAHFYRVDNIEKAWNPMQRICCCSAYSRRTVPEPPISAGKSLSLGSPSLMGSTVSA